MIERKRIEIGYRIGSLEVIESTQQRRSRYVVWRCRCDCGGEILLDTRCLQRGTVTDCGCKSNVQPGQKDLAGKRFGLLTCLKPTSKRGRSGGTVWLCRCDCGTECTAISTQLTQGMKKSCGCLAHPPVSDYVGRRFGMLQVIAYEGKKNGLHRWRCQCDCGEQTVVGQPMLQSGRTKSCGCLQRTIYKQNLRQIEGTSVALLEASKRRKIASNTSGYTGVYRNRRSQKWVAQITLKGVTHYLGSYDNIEDAVKARKVGEELHDAFLDEYYDGKYST